MKWFMLVVGLLLLGVGLGPNLGSFGVPSGIANAFMSIPTFGLYLWIFIIVGAILIVLSFRQQQG